MVTGAAGFIGARLVRHLASLGHQVRALDVRPGPAEMRHHGVQYHQGDVRDADLVRRLARGVDTIYHLASVHLDVHTSDAAFRDVNVAAAQRLVEIAAEVGVRRLVHTSSVGIYGHIADPPAREDSPKRPDTPYERTKLAGEEAVLRRAREVGVDVVVVRPAWVYGPGCPRTEKLMRMLRKRRFLYVGDGLNLRHPIYIEDMLQAFVLAGTAPASLAGGVYLIAGPRFITLREMVETFARVLGVPAPKLSIPGRLGRSLGLTAELVFGLVGREPPFSRRSLAFFENHNAFDTSAAERDLGFRAMVDLPEGLRRTVGQLGKAFAA